MEGLFLINKPTGISSREAGDLIKRKFSLNKIGHIGTLDLEASGLLLLLSGRATRLQNYFLETKKTYQGEIVLGKTSTTDDIFGEISETPNASITLNNLNKEEFLSQVRTKFSPRYFQTPPHFSAKKKDGKKSLSLAKKGILLELAPKEVENEFNQLRFLADDLIEYKIEVSSGFYVRSLARDIGDLIGVGGVTKSIERDSVGKFNLISAINLDDVSEGRINIDNLAPGNFYPLNDLFEFLNYSQVVIDDNQIRSNFLNGNIATLNSLVEKWNLGQKELKEDYNLIFKDSNGSALGIVSVNSGVAKYDYVLPDLNQ